MTTPQFTQNPDTSREPEPAEALVHIMVCWEAMQKGQTIELFDYYQSTWEKVNPTFESLRVNALTPRRNWVRPMPEPATVSWTLEDLLPGWYRHEGWPENSWGLLTGIFISNRTFGLNGASHYETALAGMSYCSAPNPLAPGVTVVPCTKQVPV